MFVRFAGGALLSFSILVAAGCDYGYLGWPGTAYDSDTAHDPHALVREARFDADEFDIWESAHEIPVVVFGDPLALGKGAFDALVVSRMQTWYWNVNALKPRLTFVPARGAVAKDSPRLVAVFDYAAGLKPQDFCTAGKVATDPPDPDTIRMRFALCRGDRVLASTRTDVWRGSADADYRFRDRVSELAFGLFPYRDVRPDVIVTAADRILYPAIGHRRFHRFGAHH